MVSKRDSIVTKGLSIDLFNESGNSVDYLSLTDIAKYRDAESPADLIKNWMRSRSTIEFLGAWEKLHNEHFNNDEYEKLLADTGSNSFLMSPSKWIKATNAIGITSKSGRYGGTYAQSDIAFEFASWISVEFRLYLIKDYQQLKQKESSQFNIEWDINRTLSKVNYKLHTDAIKDNLIPETLSAKQAGYKYASEADRLNVALFGQTAREWKINNSKKSGNIRDNASIMQLNILANLESMNAELIKQGISEYDRSIKLNTMAKEQTETLLNNAIAQKQLDHLSDIKQ